MLYLIKGDVGSGKTTRLTDMIIKAVEEKKRCYLIVPEQQTVSRERMMVERLPSYAPLYFEVTNFSRLANTVFRSYGGLSYNYSSSATRSLVMWRALCEALPSLHDNVGEVETGRVRKLLSAASEMSLCSISPDRLSAAANEVEDKSLREKLEDLSVVLTTYRRLLNEKYTDQGEDLDKLVNILRTQRFFEGATVFIDSFTSFTEQEYSVIAQILRQCDIAVTLPLPSRSEERLCFEEMRECEKKLNILAQGNIKVEKMGASRRSPSPLLSYVAEHLFSPACQSLDAYSGEREDSLTAVETPTPFDSADYIAADISRRIQNGARYKDFAIISRDSTRYEGIIDRALEKYGIPYFMSIRADISSYAAIKLIYSAYAVCAGGFERRDIVTYMKCGLCGISDRDCDELELYSQQWNLSGKAFTEAEDWNMSRSGYSTRKSDDGEFLLRINETRRRVISPLMRLYDSCREKRTVAEHCRALYDFLCELELEDKLYLLGCSQIEKGEIEDGEHILRIYAIICDALDKLADTLPDTVVSADSFIQLLRITFGETDMGKIPASCDAVTVGSADMLRAEAKHVYLLGVNAGEFPATVSESSIFSQNDRDILSDVGITLEEDLSEKASRELFCFYRALRSATESVTVIYSLADAGFSAVEPSSVISDILHLAGNACEVVKYSDIDKSELLWSRESSLSVVGAMEDTKERQAICELLEEYPEYARRIVAAGRPISNTEDRVSPELMRELYPADIHTTQSRIESYVKCGFSYFCRYALGLDENKRAKIDFSEMGNFVHAILEKLFLYLAEQNKHISKLGDDEIRETVERISAEYIREISPDNREQTPRMAHLFYRLKNATVTIVENLREEFSQSRFSPRFFEFGINDQSGCSAIDITTKRGTRIRLHGIIDRVDVYQDDNNVYVRIVDYKTGPKRFSLDLVEKGLNLQMLIYLFSIWKSSNDELKKRLGCGEGGEIFPAGILYMPTTIDDIHVSSFDEDEIDAAIDGAFKRNGLLLDDENILRAMEENLEKRFIPISMTKKGELTPKEALASLEKMGELLEKTKDIITKYCDELQDGNAKAIPLDAAGVTFPCDYCAMRAVCRKY